jgi:TRAP-type C4-dicarboxylate transport system substrate-binding protein
MVNESPRPNGANALLEAERVKYRGEAIMLGRRILLGGSAAALCSAARSARAQNSITLKLADYFPPDHFISRFGAKPFMEEVERTTGGLVKFQYYPADQLGKAQDMLTLTRAGLVDIGLIAPADLSDNKMPYFAVVELPGMFDSSCEGLNAYWRLAKEKILKGEFARNQIIPLFAYVMPPYQILTGQRQITGLESLRGSKLRTAGGAMDIMARELGAVPVRMASPEAYESLSRGTLDGLVFPLSAIEPYHMQKLLKYSTAGENFGSFLGVYAIGEAKFKSLPETARNALVQAGENVTKQMCRKIDQYELETKATLEKSGIVFTALPPEEHAKITAQFGKIAEDWAATLNSRGQPGTALLAEFRADLREPAQ